MASSSPAINRAVTVLQVGFITLLAYVPFHAFCYVVLGSNFGFIEWFKIVPSLIIGLLTPVALWVFMRDAPTRKTLSSRLINWLALGYVVLHIIIAAWKQPEASALIAGLMINLRLVAVLLLGQLIALYKNDKRMLAHISLAVIVPAIVTTIFGVLQLAVLPADFLRHFGYGSDTIRPFTTLHQGSSAIRVSSTLRGPNPFGAYLVLVISLLATQIIRLRQRNTWIVFLSISTVAIIGTFSRSAWVALAIAIGFHIILTGTPRQRNRVIIGMAMSGIVLFSGVLVFQRNSVIQNAVFHTDTNNNTVNSNQGHIAALEAAVDEVVEAPLGSGPGSAGPASVHLEKNPPRIAENYYAQIAQEVGVIGLALFLAMFGLLIRQLLRNAKAPWPSALLVSGLGLAAASMLLHVWADDTLGIIWWGLAGYFAYLPISKQPKRIYG